MRPTKKENMNIKTLFLIVIVMTTLLNPAAAMAQQHTTWGDRDCGQWTLQTDATQVAMSKVWLMGFLSGFDVLTVVLKNSSVLAKLNSAEQAYVWMDNFCKTYPLEKVSSGGAALFVELASGKKPDGYLK